MSEVYITKPMDKEIFEKKLHDDSKQLYYHLIYICALGRILPKMVPHWAHQVYYYSYKAITLELPTEYNDIDRLEIVEHMMMKPHMGISFQDYNASQFKEALEYEKNSAMNKLNNLEYEGLCSILNDEIKYIDKAIEHIDVIAKGSKSVIMDFYDEYKSAARERNLGMLLDSIKHFREANSPHSPREIIAALIKRHI